MILTWLRFTLALVVTVSPALAATPPKVPENLQCLGLLITEAQVRGANEPIVYEIPNYEVDIHLRTQPLKGYRDAVAVIFLDRAVPKGQIPRILLGKRGRGNGAGKWGIPGGKSDPVPGETDVYESPFEAACREIKQETGMILKKARLVHMELSHEEDGRNYRVFVMVAEEYEGTPTIQDEDEVKKFIYQPVTELGPAHLPDGLFKAIPIRKIVDPRILIP